MALYQAPLPKHDTLLPADDAIALLTAHHHKIRTLYQQYQRTDDQDLKRSLAEDLFATLALHATLEETVFYPAVATQTGDEGDRLVGGARHDHQVCRDLIAALRQYEAEEFEARFHILMDLVEQHMAEEETALFPQAAEHLAEGMDALTKTMQKRHHQMILS